MIGDVLETCHLCRQRQERLMVEDEGSDYAVFWLVACGCSQKWLYVVGDREDVPALTGPTREDLEAASYLVAAASQIRERAWLTAKEPVR